MATNKKLLFATGISFIILLISVSDIFAYDVEISTKESRNNGIYRFEDSKIFIYNINNISRYEMFKVLFHEMGHYHYYNQMTIEERGRLYTKDLEGNPNFSKYDSSEKFADDYAIDRLIEGGWIIWLKS